jgi:daunorubicin resistance ABC transporter membrane protein
LTAATLARASAAPLRAPWQWSASAFAVLWRRDLLRIFRQRSRLFGAVLQPLVLWLVIGSGMGESFRAGGGPGGGVGYLEYFFPGLLVMVVLFTAIFSTISLIEDRHEGFLQSVLVSPASRGALALGKIAGGATVALAQAAAVALLIPWAGFHTGAVHFALLALFVALAAVGLTAVGFVIAWVIDSTQGYHAVMSVVLIPAWVLSGAMFPAEGARPWLGAAMRANPMSYMVDGARAALYGHAAPVELMVTSIFTLAAVVAAGWVARRRA